MKTINDAVNRFLADRRQRGLVEGSLVNYKTHLDDWIGWRQSRGLAPEIAAITLDELRRYFGEVAQRTRRSNGQPLTPQYTRNIWRTVRVLWRWLAYETNGQGEPVLAHAQRNFLDPGRIPLPPQPRRERPAVQAYQIDLLLGAAGDGKSEESARDRAIVLMLWESGLRVHEVAKLHDFDVDLAERTATIIGKGSKQASVFWGPRTAHALRDYLLLRRGPKGGPLFRGCSSRNDGEEVTGNLIRIMLKKLARRAGIELPKGSPAHAFRHGFARECRRRGLSREEVSELLRHNDLATTDIYLGLDVDPRRKLHRRVFGGRE